MNDELLKTLFKNKTPEQTQELILNINRRRLNTKKHIKKYNHLRLLHSEIISSMYEYLSNGKYNIEKAMEILSKEIQKDEVIDFSLNGNNPDDISILLELFAYKNHKKVPSITEIYLEKNKFRNKEKVNFLNAMNNSYAGLFEIIDTDFENGYIYYKDIFTNKKYKVIDISMSSTFVPQKDKPRYIYNRIITVDDISFATGIHCMLTWENKELQAFLKNQKFKKYTNFSRCLMLYEMSKKEKNLITKHYHQYGYRNQY